MGEGYELTISGLMRKRGELAGQIAYAHEHLRELVVALNNLDATIHHFDSTIDLDGIAVKPLPPPHAAHKGEVSRVVLAALREAEAPLTTEEVAKQVMAERNLNVADAKLLQLIKARVGGCLRSWRARGVVAQVRAGGRLVRWRIADTGANT